MHPDVNGTGQWTRDIQRILDRSDASLARVAEDLLLSRERRFRLAFGGGADYDEAVYYATHAQLVIVTGGDGIRMNPADRFQLIVYTGVKNPDAIIACVVSALERKGIPVTHERKPDRRLEFRVSAEHHERAIKIADDAIRAMDEPRQPEFTAQQPPPEIEL